MLQIIPAIDLKEGRCVRLVQGQMDQETLYYEDPLEPARLWDSRNAPRIHVVDLDGAVSGSPRNLPVIERIIQGISIPLQVGGGIRTQEDIVRYLEIGVERVILGTLVCQDPEYVQRLAKNYPEKILLGLDAKEGYVAVRGWRDVTRVRAVDLIREVPKIPIAGIIYTDIQRDGMLVGPNLPAIQGAHAFFQWAVSDPNTAFGTSASRGLEIVLNDVPLAVSVGSSNVACRRRSSLR